MFSKFSQKLTEEQKQEYKEKSKNQSVPKLTSQGIPIDTIAREQNEIIEKAKYMERTIKRMVDFCFLNNGWYLLTKRCEVLAKIDISIQRHLSIYGGKFSNLDRRGDILFTKITKICYSDHLQLYEKCDKITNSKTNK